VVIAGVIALVVVLAVALIGGGDDNKGSAATSGSTQTTPAQPKVEGQLALKGGGKARGLASLVSQGSTRAMALVGEKMPANGSNDTYVVWLTGPNGKVQRLGFPQQKVTKDGKFSALAVLPNTLTGLDTVVISLEKTQDPKAPTRTILAGKLADVQPVTQQPGQGTTGTTTTPSG
jgi:hypothetical protein